MRGPGFSTPRPVSATSSVHVAAESVTGSQSTLYPPVREATHENVTTAGSRHVTDAASRPDGSLTRNVQDPPVFQPRTERTSPAAASMKMLAPFDAWAVWPRARAWKHRRNANSNTNGLHGPSRAIQGHRIPAVSHIGALSFGGSFRRPKAV
jgi:hypothetical protein